MKIKRIIIGALIAVYLIVAVFLTACLLAYNDYNISVFGDKTFVIVKNDEFEPNYKKGDLLIITKNKNDDIKVNDDIFFYNRYKNQITVSHSKVTKTEKLSDTETTYTIPGDGEDYYVSSSNVIGKADTTTVFNGVGGILGFLESRWGFLFIIVLPISVLFIYEIYIVVKEIVKPEDEEEKVENKPKKELDEPEKEEPKDEEKKEEPEKEISESVEENSDEKPKEEPEEKADEKSEQSEAAEEPEAEPVQNESSESKEEVESEDKVEI